MPSSPIVHRAREGAGLVVFDLFVGAWEARDARRHGIPHLHVVPCLFFTLMLGPIGLALYLVLRLALSRRAALDEGSEPLVTRSSA